MWENEIDGVLILDLLYEESGCIWEFVVENEVVYILMVVFIFKECI